MQFLSSESTFKALHSFMNLEAFTTMLKVERQSQTLPVFSDPRLFEELFCSSFKWTSSAVSGLNQLTNTRNYTVKKELDFGNPKKMRFLAICILFRVLKRLEEEGGGGWQIVTDFVTRLMRPKYLLKKSDRRCTFTQLANKKNDSVTFSIRITFEQVSKQRLKVKNSIKRLLNAIFLLDF